MSLGAILVLVGVIATSGVLLWIAWRYLPERHLDQQQSLLQVFSTAIELRFPSQEGLTDRVVSLSAAVALELGLSRRAVVQIEQAARLRDVGLCAIPWKLVNERPEGDWSEAERATYDRHTEVSGAMLELVPSIRDLAPIVRHHHAPYAPDLPLASRIIAVVDAYVSVDRQQGSLLARAHIIGGKASMYDPVVVEACLRVLPSVSAAESLAVIR